MLRTRLEIVLKCGLLVEVDVVGFDTEEDPDTHKLRLITWDGMEEGRRLIYIDPQDVSCITAIPSPIPALEFTN